MVSRVARLSGFIRRRLRFVKKFEEPHRVLHHSIKEINLNLSEAEDLEGAKGDYRSITLPALEKVMGIFTELSDFPNGGGGKTA